MRRIISSTHLCISTAITCILLSFPLHLLSFFISARGDSSALRPARSLRQHTLSSLVLSKVRSLVLMHGTHFTPAVLSLYRVLNAHSVFSCAVEAYNKSLSFERALIASA